MWYFDCGFVDEFRGCEFADKFQHAPAVSPFLGPKVAITGAERAALMQCVYAELDVERDDARAMLQFVTVAREE